jgi:diguanylate cyclase (GGDEF)-like protein
LILKQKPRSLNVFLLYAAALLILLAGFFLYAARGHSRFFSLLSIILAVNIAMLLVFYRRLKQKEASARLQREEFFEKTNLLKADLDAESRAVEAFRGKIESYSRLKGLLEALSMSLTVDDTVHVLCRETAAFFGRQDAEILLYALDPASGSLERVHSAQSRSQGDIKARHGDVFDRWIMRSLQALLVEDSRKDFRFDPDRAGEEEPRPVRSLVGVPLMVDRRLTGIIRIDSSSSGTFTEEDLRLLRAIGDIAAVAIENARLYDKVEALAVRDGLTGLFLRRYFMERVTEEMLRHRRHAESLAFIMFDLDHFKDYNDRFGHSAGDLVLKKVADLLQICFNDMPNVICRYGGEEFAVLLPGCPGSAAAEKARSFAALLREQDIILRREHTRITVSAGVAASAQNVQTPEDLIKKADTALYSAKNRGRDRVCLSA